MRKIREKAVSQELGICEEKRRGGGYSEKKEKKESTMYHQSSAQTNKGDEISGGGGLEGFLGGKGGSLFIKEESDQTGRKPQPPGKNLRRGRKT